MKKPLLVGAMAGILITACLALFLRDLHQKGLVTGTGGIVTTDGISERDPENSPLVTVLNQFDLRFPGSDDMLMRRVRTVHPQATIPIWEKVMSESGLPVNQRTTLGCQSAELSRSVTVRSEQTQSILSGQTNVLFIPNDTARCFATQSKLVLVVDDPINAKLLFDLPAVVNVERLVETRMSDIQPELMWALKVTREDLPYLAFGVRGLANLNLNVTLVHFTLSTEKPLLDPRKIPSFMAGAEGIRAIALPNYLRKLESLLPPVFVDTRDQRVRSAGVLPGAVSAPFIASDERQLRFLLDMPMTLAAGARFDTSKLPEAKLTPLVLFGNDDQDASVVWVARNLRLLGYRRIFFVIGGLEAIKRDAPGFKL